MESLPPAWQLVIKSRRHLKVSSGGYYHFVPVSVVGRNTYALSHFDLYTSSQENPEWGQFSHLVCTLLRCKNKQTGKKATKKPFSQNLICRFHLRLNEICLFLCWWLCKKTGPGEAFPQRLKGGITTTTTTCQGICKACWGSRLAWEMSQAQEKLTQRKRLECFFPLQQSTSDSNSRWSGNGVFSATIRFGIVYFLYTCEVWNWHFKSLGGKLFL